MHNPTPVPLKDERIYIAGYETYWTYLQTNAVNFERQIIKPAG